MKKCISTIVLMSAMLMLAATACAKPHQLAIQWPVTDCDGDPVVATDLFESELIYSTSAMPMPSDIDGDCAQPGDPDAPAGALSVPVPVVDSAVTINLQPGQTYYARIRVSTFIAGNWSAWSNQVQFTVPYGRPTRVIFGSNSVLRWEADMIGTTRLRFKKKPAPMTIS